ncbi:MAG: tetrahydrofolate dehydrogenase/cyclohydrolase catalytic domain-containing protein [Eubacteriales bacterium]|jgi:methylenetetrahydrofolate dehydrogenase (NADP+)/methenyltetrahydrofolate cyclohydrolase
MSFVLSGKETANSIFENLRPRADAVTASGHTPTLAVVRTGEKKSDLAYERGIRKHADMAGCSVVTDAFPQDVSEEDLVSRIRELNEDETIDGILIFQPLPKQLNAHRVIEAISAGKDVDGATDASRLFVYTGHGSGFAPCTAQSVIEILDYYGVALQGKHAVIVGRSMVVGKPLANLFLARNATVTVCHSKTEDLPAITKTADILVSATGHIGTIGGEHVSKDQYVLDVGINFGADGKMTGDVLSGEVSPLVRALTPVPGGVGSVTTAVLFKHVVESAEGSV